MFQKSINSDNDIKLIKQTINLLEQKLNWIKYISNNQNLSIIDRKNYIDVFNDLQKDINNLKIEFQKIINYWNNININNLKAKASLIYWKYNK